ncbi:MAG: thioesterase family protein [PVC group bacterium]
MSQTTTISYRVPYADTDQMGVVYYANYLVYFERLRNELLRQTGTPYRAWEEKGVMLPVVEACCRYRAPAHYDDLLTISGRISRSRGSRLRIEYEVRTGGAILADGYTVHACLKRSGRPTRIPAELTVESTDAGEAGAPGRKKDDRP